MLRDGLCPPRPLLFCHNNHVTRLLPILALLLATPILPAGQSSSAPPTISLDSLPGNGPALLLFDANAGGSHFRSQWSALTHDAAELGELTVIPILSESSVPLPPSHGLKVATLNDVDAANARSLFHCSSTSFCVVLLGKDGRPIQIGDSVTTSSLMKAINPPPTQLERAITEGQNSVYRTLIAGPSANPFTLADLLDAGRPLLIFAQSAADPAFQAQWTTLTQHVPDLVGRSVVAIPVFVIRSPALPPAHGLPVKTLDDVNNTKARNDFSCGPASFCVILLDMADKTLLSSNSPVSIGQIIAAIGPMQQTPAGP